MGSGHDHRDSDQPRWYRIIIAVVLVIIVAGMLYVSIRGQ